MPDTSVLENLQHVVDTTSAQIVLIGNSNRFAIVRLIAIQLQKQGGYLHVKDAYSPQEAIKLLFESHIDVLILDWDVSRPADLDVIQLLKSDERIGHIPILVIVGEGRYKDGETIEVIEQRVLRYVQMALEAGATDTLPRSFRTPALLEKVAGLLSRSNL